MNEKEFDKRVCMFYTALNDIYTNVDERESSTFPPIFWMEETLTDDFTAMILAVCMLYRDKCDDNEDIIGFTHIANRLAHQYCIKIQKGES